jgi:hypothetical protein
VGLPGISWKLDGLINKRISGWRSKIQQAKT